MLALKDFILENLTDQEMKDYILQAINNMDSSQLQKTYKDFINANFDVKDLENYLKLRGVDDIWKQLYRIFKDNSDDMDLLIKIISGEVSNLPNTEKFLNSNNVFTLFGKSGLGFSDDLIKDLIEIRTPKNSIARGPFEVLCLCLMADIAPENDAKKIGRKRSSDVNTTSKEGCLEFKGDDARVKGMALRSPEFIDKKMVELLTDKILTKDLKHIKNIFSKQANIENILNSIIVPVVYKDNDPTELQKILAYSIAAQFEDGAEKDIEGFIKYIWDDIFKNGKFDKKIFSKVFGVLDMHYYQKSDEWDNMIIFKNKASGIYTVINKSEVQDLNSLWRNNKITFTGNPKPGSPLDYAVHIHAV